MSWTDYSSDMKQNIFVTNVRRETTADDLQRYFERFGKVLNVNLPEPYRPFAIITFLEASIAEKLVETVHFIKGSKMICRAYVQKSETRNYWPDGAHGPRGIGIGSNCNHIGAEGVRQQLGGVGPRGFVGQAQAEIRGQVGCAANVGVRPWASEPSGFCASNPLENRENLIQGPRTAFTNSVETQSSNLAAPLATNGMEWKNDSQMLQNYGPNYPSSVYYFNALPMQLPISVMPPHMPAASMPANFQVQNWQPLAGMNQMPTITLGVGMDAFMPMAQMQLPGNILAISPMLPVQMPTPNQVALTFGSPQLQANIRMQGQEMVTTGGSVSVSVGFRQAEQAAAINANMCPTSTTILDGTYNYGFKFYISLDTHFQ